MTWLVVYTASRSEYLAWSQITAAGFESYFPVYRRRLHRSFDQRSGGSKHVFSPLFPRYVFVGMHPLWQVIHAFRGVAGFLLNDGMPMQISQQVIEDIKKRQYAGEFDEKPEPKRERQRAKSFRELKKMLEVVDNARAA